MAVIGPLPVVYPDWLAVFALLGDLLALVDERPRDGNVAASEANAMLRRRAAEAAGVERVVGTASFAASMGRHGLGPDAWVSAFESWALGLAGALALGRAAPS